MLTRNERGRPRAGARIAGPYRTGKRYQIIRYGSSGERLAAKYFASKAAAERFAAEARRQLGGEQETVSSSLQAYETHQRAKGLRPRTISNARAAIVALWGHEVSRPMAQLGQALLAGRVAERLQACTVAAVATEVRTMKTWARWAKAEGLLTDGQLAGLLSIVVQGPRGRGKPQLTVSEARAWLAVALQWAREGHEGALVNACCLLLGLRLREVLDRQARDVDDGGRLLWVRDAKTRAGDRRVEVPEVLQGLLCTHAEARQPTELVFSGDGQTPRASSWGRKWCVDICKAAGTVRVTPHGLRGTHATLAEAAGATGHLVASSLGHSSTEVAARHYTAPGVRQQAARGRALQVIQGGRE